jgi:hypothetical protein
MGRASMSGGGSTYVRNQKKVTGMMLNSSINQGQTGIGPVGDVVNSRAAANSMEYFIRKAGSQ